MKFRNSYICLSAILQTVIALHTAAAADFGGTWEGAYYTTAVGYQTATIHLLQAGNAVSGTYSSSTGLDGTLSGTAAGDKVEFVIAHAGSCQGFFYGEGVLDGDLLRIEMGGADCASPQRVLVTAVLAKNLDLSFRPWVAVDKIVSGFAGNSGGVWSGLDHPHPETIAAVTMITPGGYRIPMAYDEEDANWDTDMSEVPAAKLDLLFPNGIYLYAIDYLDGTSATGGTLLDAQYPASAPVVDAPAHGSLFDPAAALTVTWQPADATVDNIWIDPGDGGGAQYPAGSTQFTIPAGTLEDNQSHYFWLAFSNTSPSYFGNRTLATQPVFYAGTRLADAYIGLVNARAPSGQTGMLFVSNLESIGVGSASLATPRPETLFYTGEEQGDDWGVEVMTTPGEAAWRFPDGGYLMSATFTSGPAENRALQLLGIFPASTPLITSPVNGSTVDLAAASFACSWAPWDGGTGVVMAKVNKIAAVPADNGFDSQPVALVYETMLEPDDTGLSLPTALLDADSAYELSVMFINPVGSGAFKTTRSHVFFRTGCHATLSHTHMGFEPSAGSDEVGISAPECFSWAAVSNESWIKITAGGGGKASGTVAFSVTRNWRTSDRQGSLEIAGETFKVYQLAGPTPCPHFPVKREEDFYDSLVDAYAAAVGGDTIRCQYADLAEDVDFDREIDLAFVGGYNCDYSVHPDATTLLGQVTFSRGSVTVDGMIVAGK